MAISTRPLTDDDLIQMPDDGNRYELIGGELIVSPSPLPIHQRVVLRLVLVLLDFVEKRQLGEVFSAPLDIKLSKFDVVQPDIVYLSRERFGVVDGLKPIVGAPDLLVEVLSPSTHVDDEGRKMRLYAQSGVREYWLVDTERQTVRILALKGGQYEAVSHEQGVARSVVLPGLTVDVASLFEGIE